MEVKKGCQFVKDGLTHYQRNKDYYRDKRRAQSKRIRKFLDEYKRGRACVDCGYSNNEFPATLDFDHLPTSEKKKINLSQGVSWGIDKLLAEIAKCEIVCSNCHRIRTTKRMKAPLV